MDVKGDKEKSVEPCSKCKREVVLLEGARWHKLPYHGLADEKCKYEER